MILSILFHLGWMQWNSNILQVSDNPSNRERALRSLALIAEDRKSEPLNVYLRTGELGTTAMDIGEAYSLLQIPDRTIDDAAILAAFSVCESEAPSQIELYRKALSVIAAEKDSPMLNSALTRDQPQSDRVLSEWPVGLRNIGNTCYLNSLLQFYFTVKPFRDMILHIDDFKMPLDDESIQKKQVGSRKVSKKEIERSQLCE
jgi:ubiquitin carboxyl-terminal hydrolase 25/28